MIQTNCLVLSPEANAHAKAKTMDIEGPNRLGWRFESEGPGTHRFTPMQEVRVKDYVLQPRVGGVIVFVDPDSLEKGYGTDIDFDGKAFVFTQSDRAMPKVAEKSEEQKSEEKARRAAARASKGMKPGAEKATVRKAVKEASLAADEAKASKKKAKPANSVDKREQSQALDAMAALGASARAIELQAATEQNIGWKKVVSEPNASAEPSASVKAGPKKATVRKAVKTSKKKSVKTVGDASESMLRLLELDGLAKETFETPEEAAGWMGQPHPMLDGESPLECAKSSFGAQRVKDILVAIKHGGVV